MFLTLLNDTLTASHDNATSLRTITCADAFLNSLIHNIDAQFFGVADDYERLHDLISAHYILDFNQFADKHNLKFLTKSEYLRIQLRLGRSLSAIHFLLYPKTTRQF